MSWKRATETEAGAPASIAGRLTAWYALFSVVLIAAAGSALYWLLAQRLHEEDDRILAGKIAEIGAVLKAHPGNRASVTEEVEHESETLRGVYIRVIGGQSGVVAQSAHFAWLVDDRGRFAGGEAADGEARDWRSGDGGAFRIMSERLARPGPYTLQAALDLSGEARLLSSYRWALLIAVTAALAVALGAGYFIARRALRPVSDLAGIVDRLGAGQLHRRVGEEHWPAELRSLARNFDRLLSRLEDSFTRMSRFSADLAHELRTPLHILRGEAETTLAKERSEADYRACLESAADEYDRLSRMVDALLFLARSEQPDAHIDKRPLDVQQEVAAVFDFYQAMADEHGITLTCEGRATVAADAGLLRRALGNLLANALRHTRRGGRITVAAEAAPEEVRLLVSDTGEGIARADLPYVIDRFYRADESRPRQGQGAGLGLAIVRSIMHLHGGALAIDSEVGRGTCVTLHFPSPAFA